MDQPLDLRRPATPLCAVGFNEHLKFFDSDGDDQISPAECRRGLERLGFGHLVAFPAAIAINLSVAGLGLMQRLPLHPAKLGLPRTGFVRHPDTDLVDRDGNFDDARLDALFARSGRRFAGEALTLGELTAMLLGHLGGRALEDGKQLLLLPIGAPAVLVEWGALFWLASTLREGKRVLEKDSVRRFYTDADFFHELERRIEESRYARRHTTLGAARNGLQRWLF